MKTSLIVLVFVSIGVCSGWQFKADDTPQLKAEGENFAQYALQDFKIAASRSKIDKTEMMRYWLQLKRYLSRAEANNEKLAAGISKIVGQLKTIISWGVNPASSHPLYVLTAAIDGNRDNVSYYVLDYCREWIDRRVESLTSAPDLKQALLSIRKDIVTARDALDANAQVFVNGIKDLKNYSFMGMAWRHAKEVKAIIQKLDEGSKDTTFIIKTKDAANQIQNLLDEDDDDY